MAWPLEHSPQQFSELTSPCDVSGPQPPFAFFFLSICKLLRDYYN
jgi:hypothetical protein